MELAKTERGELTVTVATPRDRHPAVVYLARLSPGSRRAMRQALDVIAGILTGVRCNAEALAWPALRYQHTAAVRSVLAERYSPAMANKSLSALRGVLKECWRLGQTPADDYRKAADLEAVKGTTLPRGRALAAGELRALFSACAEDPTPAGTRDAALLCVLYGAGLRRSEVVALDLAGYNQETGELIVKQGKGRKDRMGYATNGSKGAIEAWVRVRGSAPGPLFYPINKGGNLQAHRMTDQAVLYVLEKRAAQARITHCSPHDMRRSFISDLLDAGADISSVQRLAGHSSVTTTQRYDRRGEQAKRKAAELLHVPYFG